MKYGLYWVLIGMLLLAATSVALVGTHQGLMLALKLVERYTEGFLVKEAQGTLGSGFTLTGLDYQKNTTRIHCDQLRLVIKPQDLWQGEFHIETLALQGIEGYLEPRPATGQTHWNVPNIHPLLRLMLDDLSITNVTWHLDGQSEPLRIDTLSTTLALTQQGLDIRQLNLASPLAQLKLAGGWHPGQGEPLGLDLSWRVPLPQSPTLEGQGTVQGDFSRLTIRQTLTAPIPAALQGEVVLQTGTPNWTAQLSVPEVSLEKLAAGIPAWPVQATLKAEGSGRGIQWGGQAAITLPELGRVTAQGQFDYQPGGELNISRLELDSSRSEARLVLDGHISSFSAFDLQAHWKKLVWPLSAPLLRSEEGELKLKGRLDQLEAHLQGLLQNRRLEASAKLGIADHQVDIRQLNVTAAETRLDLSGRYGDALDLAWTFRAGNLGFLLDGSRGQLESRGKLTGSPRLPVIEAEALGTALNFRDFGVNRLSLHAKTGTHPDAPINLDLSLMALRRGSDSLDFTLQGTGTPKRHRLVARVSHVRYPLALDLEGSWQDTRWQGQISRFDWTQPGLGVWMLQRPASLEINASTIRTGEICWRHAAAEWCGSGHSQGQGRWQVNTRLQALPLTQLIPQPPQNLNLEGLLQAEAEFSGIGSRLDAGRMALRGQAVSLHYHSRDGNTWQFLPHDAELQGTVSQGQGQFKILVQDSAFATVVGDVSVKGGLDLAHVGSWPLAGHIELNMPDLKVMAPDRLDRQASVEGQGQLSLHVSGQVAAPGLQLQAAVNHASLALPNLGIKLTDMELQAMPASDQSNKVELQARARSGQGIVRLEGSGLLDAAKGWPWTLRLTGENFLAANTQVARLIISPELNFATTGSTLRLDGQIRIPQARMTLPEQQIVKVSSDTVRTDLPVADQSNTPNLSSHIQLQLGEDVRFEGSGVSARLGGELSVEQLPGEPAQATGQILLKEGQYTFHTVKLPLSGGRLSYNHSPLDNPELDFNILRQTEGVTAGIRVLGVLQNPSFTLHSDPVMPESDILAYLISGKPFNLSSSQDGQLMQQAATSLSGPVGNLLMKEVASRFGFSSLLDDVAVQAPKGNQSTALFLGKYLTPRLYLQYGVGLAQASNVFKIRYELGKYWKIQSETGEYSGGDIVFEMER